MLHSHITSSPEFTDPERLNEQFNREVIDARSRANLAHATVCCEVCGEHAHGLKTSLKAKGYSIFMSGTGLVSDGWCPGCLPF